MLLLHGIGCGAVIGASFHGLAGLARLHGLAGLHHLHCLHGLHGLHGLGALHGCLGCHDGCWVEWLPGWKSWAAGAWLPVTGILTQKNGL